MNNKGVAPFILINYGHAVPYGRREVALVLNKKIKCAIYNKIISIYNEFVFTIYKGDRGRHKRLNVNSFFIVDAGHVKKLSSTPDAYKESL